MVFNDIMQDAYSGCIPDRLKYMGVLPVNSVICGLVLAALVISNEHTLLEANPIETGDSCFQGELLALFLVGYRCF